MRWRAPDDKEKMSKIASQNCPKCDGSRRFTKIESGEYSGCINFGGRIRKQERYVLYAIKCDVCDFVEIYSGSKL